MNLLINKFRTYKTKQAFVEDFFKSENHIWIANDRYLKSSFEELFLFLPLNVINDLNLRFKGISFTKDDQNSYFYLDDHTVRSLKSFNPDEAFVKIIHRLIKLSKSNLEEIEAQIYADKVTYNVGYKKEVEELINEEREEITKRVRLSYLTSHAFSEDS